MAEILVGIARMANTRTTPTVRNAFLFIPLRNMLAKLLFYTAKKQFQFCYFIPDQFKK